MKRKIKISQLGVAAILLCLVLVSAHFVSGLQARFITMTDGSDTGHTAAFLPSAEAADDAVTIEANGKAEYIITIRNEGETAVFYEAVVKFTGEDEETSGGRFDSGTEEEQKLSFTGVLPPNSDTEKSITLDMTEYFDGMDNKWSTLSNDDISGEAGTLPFTVVVTFTQSD